jgi:hypothetical protein
VIGYDCDGVGDGECTVICGPYTAGGNPEFEAVLDDGEYRTSCGKTLVVYSFRDVTIPEYPWFVLAFLPLLFSYAARRISSPSA